MSLQNILQIIITRSLSLSLSVPRVTQTTRGQVDRNSGRRLFIHKNVNYSKIDSTPVGLHYIIIIAFIYKTLINEAPQTQIPHRVQTADAGDDDMPCDHNQFCGDTSGCRIVGIDKNPAVIYLLFVQFANKTHFGRLAIDSSNCDRANIQSPAKLQLSLNKLYTKCRLIPVDSAYNTLGRSLFSYPRTLNPCFCCLGFQSSPVFGTAV